MFHRVIELLRLRQPTGGWSERPTEPVNDAEMAERRYNGSGTTVVRQWNDAKTVAERRRNGSGTAAERRWCGSGTTVKRYQNDGGTATERRRNDDRTTTERSKTVVEQRLSGSDAVVDEWRTEEG